VEGVLIIKVVKERWQRPVVINCESISVYFETISCNDSIVTDSLFNYVTMSACKLEDRVSRVKFEVMQFILWMQLIVLMVHRGHISECLALLMCLIFLRAQYTNFDGSVFSRTSRSIYSDWRNICQESVICEGILKMNWDVF